MQLEASTSCSDGEVGIVYMSEGKSVRQYKYVSEHSYDVIILIFTYQKKSWEWQLLATIRQEDPVRATNLLALN